MHTSPKSRLFLLPLIAGLLWAGVMPARASGESWVVESFDSIGCNSGEWNFTVVFAGVDGGTYVPHTTVTSAGKVYMNEDATFAPIDGAGTHWGLKSDFSYGAVSNPGTWPIAPGQPMTVTFSLERPRGNVLYSWSLVAESCDSRTLLVNGPDLDQDLVANAADTCPTLKAATANGCPPRDRSLTLQARYGPKRVVGRLYAAGHPALYADRKVTIWKVVPGPDRTYAVRTTNSLGRFRARMGRGRYYATTRGLIVPTAGQVSADLSPTVRVR